MSAPAASTAAHPIELRLAARVIVDGMAARAARAAHDAPLPWRTPAPAEQAAAYSHGRALAQMHVSEQLAQRAFLTHWQLIREPHLVLSMIVGYVDGHAA